MRLFIGIDLPEEVKEHLDEISKEIGDEFAKINFVSKENLHITLKFLGDVKDNDLEKVRNALTKLSFEGFELCVNKIGFFPSENYVRVIWVGFKNEEKLFELHKLVDFSLSKYFGVERNFLGHMTLGRVKFVMDKVGFKEKISGVKIEERCFDVKSFKLVKSTLTEKGPVYSVLDEYNLK